MTSDKEFYNIIADEMANKTMDQALWVQALALSEGNADKAQATYIKLRFAELRKSAAANQAAQGVVHAAAPAGAGQHDGELAKLRANLGNKLRTQGKNSLYATLGAQPEDSDASIASAIAELDARVQGGDVIPGFKYAKETLGDPQSRENYDRMMLVSLTQANTAGYARARSLDDVPEDTSWWHSKKVSAIIVVLSIAILGYLGLGFFKENGGQQIQKEALGVQRDAIQSSASVEDNRTNADHDTASQMIDAAQQAQQQQNDLRDRQLLMQQQAQESRDELERERLALQRQQMESQQQQRQQQADNMKQQREKQYWSCVNSQVNVYQPSGTTAMARCAYLRP